MAADPWFRWYVGTADDGKMRVTARYASVTLRDVLAVWVILLEEASRPEHRGVCRKSARFIAALLDLDETVLGRIIEGFGAVDMLVVGDGGIHITNWNKRQFKSDAEDPTAPERMRKSRARKRQRYADVTPSYGSDICNERPEAEAEAEKEERSIIRQEAHDDTPSVSAGAEAAVVSAPPIGDVLWRECLTYLTSCGVPDRHARSALGGWRKRYGAGEVAAAVVEAQRASVSQPLPYIEATLKRRLDTAPKRSPYAPAVSSLDIARRFAEREAQRNGRSDAEDPPDDGWADGRALSPPAAH